VRHYGGTRKLRVAIIDAGLMPIGQADNYHERDIRYSAAFYIDVNKTLKDLWGDLRSTNNSYKFKFANVPQIDVQVQRRMSITALANIYPTD
jgi:hypothetical protein